MNQKGLSNTLVIILALVIIAGVAGYFIFSQKQETTPATTNTLTSNTVQNTPLANAPVSGDPSLSADKKSVVVDGKVLLAVDDDIIFNWFKTDSQLCDERNLTSAPDRKMFCENKTSFKSETRFSSIVVSPDKMKIGFTIESDTLSPDKVAGIFLRSTNKIQILTYYYLGNEFISFSPSGANFVFSSYCFESDCGFIIKNSDTLTDKINFGNTPDHSDYRFVKWISDKEIEYKDGTELRRKSF